MAATTPVAIVALSRCLRCEEPFSFKEDEHLELLNDLTNQFNQLN